MICIISVITFTIKIMFEFFGLKIVKLVYRIFKLFQFFVYYNIKFNFVRDLERIPCLKYFILQQPSKPFSTWMYNIYIVCIILSYRYIRITDINSETSLVQKCLLLLWYNISPDKQYISIFSFDSFFFKQNVKISIVIFSFFIYKLSSLFTNFKSIKK